MPLTEIHLRKVTPDRNQYRFYRMFIQQGLFGGYAVCREWGRIGQPGTVHEHWYSNMDQADAMLTQRAAAKVRRGYTSWPGTAATTQGRAREGNGLENGKGAYPKGTFCLRD